MRVARLVILGLVLVVIIGCASVGLGKKDSERAQLLISANSFYHYTDTKNYEGMWLLSSPDLKQAIPKEEFVKQTQLYLSYISTINHYDLIVIFMNEKLAVTQANVSIRERLKDGVVGRVINICERIVWLRLPDGWHYDEAGRECSYMPDKERMESLTKNIPNR